MELTQGGTTQTQATYGYDSLARIATLGNGSDTLSYSYRPGMNQLQTAQWRNAQDEALNGRSYEYDTRHRLTEIKLDGVREVAYTLNDKNQRVGATLANGDNWAYAYDTLGQLTGAEKKDSQNNTLNSMNYAFDLIGNRTSAVEDAVNWTYASNLLNQYTAINAMVPTYDADGNMLTWNGWIYTWNGENRLIAAENGDTRVEMSYDYTGRRFEKKVYKNNIQLVKHEKYVYNGYKQIASYDAQNSDALSATYTWQPVGLDVPVSMTRDGETYYVVTDGNKNVTALLDTAGARVAEYTYGPFGQTLEANGGMAEDNPFRFSSEFHDDELNLVYYNYRHYNPTLGRWIKRDPVEEDGGTNLYGMVGNNPTNKWDKLGWFVGSGNWDIFIPPSDATSAHVAQQAEDMRKIKGCCGKDITAQLNSVLTYFTNELSQYPQALHFYGMFHVNNGWDITELANMDTATPSLKGWPLKSFCEATVTYKGKCYRASHLNYVLWGIIMKLRRNSFSPLAAVEHYGASSAYLFGLKAKIHDEPDGFISAGFRKSLFISSGVDFDGELALSVIQECQGCTVFDGNLYEGTLTASIRKNWFSDERFSVNSDGVVVY